MESYSHDAFVVTGYKVTITNREDEMKVIQDAWKKFKSEKYFELTTLNGHFSNMVHVVYYNYKNQDDQSKKGYNMLLGYLTDSFAAMHGAEITTITIPQQHYKYVTIK